jgi:hypothetical protein
MPLSERMQAVVAEVIGMSRIVAGRCPIAEENSDHGRLLDRQRCRGLLETIKTLPFRSNFLSN